MIGKKIENLKKFSSKNARVCGLVDYIVSPENTDQNEKCVCHGAADFISDEHESRKAEMLALASSAVRSNDPILHVVLSHREGERPTPAQAEEQVLILLDELGLSGHQVIWGQHADTDNMHLHVAVNRVHPETGKVIEVNYGWDKEAIHKAVARIEHVQGWEREPNGRYIVRDGNVVRATPKEKYRVRQPSQRAKDFEHRTGEKSAERIGIERVPQIVKDAVSWDDLHRRMSEAGMRYERKGSGALVWIEGQPTPVKASAADRNASLAKLEKCFGTYRDCKTDLRSQNVSAKIEAFAEAFPEYWQERREYFKGKSEAWAGRRVQDDEDWKELRERQKREREDVFGGRSWKGKGDELNALRSALAAQHAGQKAALKEKIEAKRKALREQFPPFSDMETWLAERKPGQEHAYRYRKDPQAASIEARGQEPENVQPGDIRAFRFEVRNGATLFRRQGKGAAAFIDRGRRIDVRDTSRDSVLAALQLAAQKWPAGIEITGSEEYKKTCVVLAVEHNFRLLNPELKKQVQVIRVAQERQQDTNKRCGVSR